MLKRLIITGSTLRIRDNKFKAKVSKEIQKFILPLLENGKIKIFVDSVFNFEDVVNAHKRIDMGTHIGKIVLNLKDIYEKPLMPKATASWLIENTSFRSNKFLNS